jgi:8-oxo-dGTP pyrophosphatase MutT (NUDIX family)
MKSFNFYFDTITKFYGTTCAERSGVPYIAHIIEGLNVLDAIGASDEAKFAYMLHLMFQNDEAFVNLKKYAHVADPYILGLCIEYRRVANAYLSKRKIESIEEIELSPLKDVNDMLIADKVQNCKDFELYQQSHPRHTELQQYFTNWHNRLGINYDELKLVCFNVAVTCIIQAKTTIEIPHGNRPETRFEYFLLNRYNNDRTMAGQCNTGGKIDVGEKILDALYREMREEINFIPPSTPEYFDCFYAQTKRGPKAVLTYIVEIPEKIDFEVNLSEFESGGWVNKGTFDAFWYNDVFVDEERDNFFGLDFDGTVIDAADWPAIGEPLPYAIETLQQLVAPKENKPKNHIVVWTMRGSNNNTAIREFFAKHNLPIYAINCHKIQWEWTNSPKLYADYFIDDRSIGVKKIGHNLDWKWMQKELKKLGFI